MTTFFAEENITSEHRVRDTALAEVAMAAGALRQQGFDYDGMLESLRRDFGLNMAVRDGDLKLIAQAACPVRLPYLTEIDAAKAFVSRYGNDLRYCARAGGWLVYSNGRWAKDENGEVFRLAERVTSNIADAAFLTTDLDERKRINDFAKQLRRRRVLENMVGAAAWQKEVAIGDPTVFDADPWLFNVANGTIDLRTGDLLEHDRANLLTKIVPIKYDPNARCPRWLQFLDEVFAGDAETVAFVRRVIGYTLTGSNREQAMFVCYGVGHNGKSTLFGIVRNILGDYGDETSSSTFMDRQSGGMTNDLAKLHGARFVSAIETGERSNLAEGLVKAVTGGDRISARFLHQEFFSFEPVFKLWLATNHKPVIKGTDRGIWRRVHLIPFMECFEGTRDDKGLRPRLEAELSGILTWAVQGCLEWQQHGLQVSSTVANATANYRAEMDLFAGFIEEKCLVEESACAGSGELYQSYRSWAEANGERPLSQKWFALRLSDRGFNQQRSKKKRLWMGLELLEGDA